MNTTNIYYTIDKPNVLYLVYKRLRIAFGVPIGFMLMYAAYTGSPFTLILLMSGFGVLCIQLFGDFYNDYVDYSEDIRNERHDKITTNKILSLYHVRNLSLSLLFAGLIVLGLTHMSLFIWGLCYSILLWAYSAQSIRLKKYNIMGYIVAGSPFLFLPYFLGDSFRGGLATPDLVFLSLFYFTQCMYISCQKDSTDTKDVTNLFIDKGWKQASFITLIFASLSSISLLSLCLNSVWLLSVWGINFSSKILNVSKIWKKEMSRELRSKLILVEFLTPYLYLLAVLL